VSTPFCVRSFGEEYALGSRPVFSYFKNGRWGVVETLTAYSCKEPAIYFAFEKSSTANIWLLCSATPMPAESMSLSSMLARCKEDFMKLR
jgi:hypothetical protein